MSKTTKAATASGAKGEEPPFEEALKRLEAIVESMEADDIPLETLLARFEEGTQLARSCQNRLAEAELKIQQLERDSAGNLAIKPMPIADNPAGA